MGICDDFYWSVRDPCESCFGGAAEIPLAMKLTRALVAKYHLESQNLSTEQKAAEFVTWAISGVFVCVSAA